MRGIDQSTGGPGMGPPPLFACKSVGPDSILFVRYITYCRGFPSAPLLFTVNVGPPQTDPTPIQWTGFVVQYHAITSYVILGKVFVAESGRATDELLHFQSSNKIGYLHHLKLGLCIPSTLLVCFFWFNLSGGDEGPFGD